ncbi:hypothetical protein ABKS39_10655 [Enterobacter cloacae]
MQPAQRTFIFFIFPQTKPDYGLAVWDASGTLILTNETRTLSDVNVLGTAADASLQDTTSIQLLAGKWACMPAMLGLITGLYRLAVSRSHGHIQEHGKTLREAIRGYSPTADKSPQPSKR